MARSTGASVSAKSESVIRIGSLLCQLQEKIDGRFGFEICASAMSDFQERYLRRNEDSEDPAVGPLALRCGALAFLLSLDAPISVGEIERHLPRFGREDVLQALIQCFFQTVSRQSGETVEPDGIDRLEPEVVGASIKLLPLFFSSICEAAADEELVGFAPDKGEEAGELYQPGFLDEDMAVIARTRWSALTNDARFVIAVARGLLGIPEEHEVYATLAIMRLTTRRRDLTLQEFIEIINVVNRACSSTHPTSGSRTLN